MARATLRVAPAIAQYEVTPNESKREESGDQKSYCIT